MRETFFSIARNFSFYNRNTIKNFKSLQKYEIYFTHKALYA